MVENEKLKKSPYKDKKTVRQIPLIFQSILSF